MKIEQLRLYNKYKDIDEPNIEYIYIGVDNDGDYWFLYKHEDYYNTPFSHLKFNGFDPDKIVKDSNLDFIDIHGNKYITGCDFESFSEEIVENYFKPILKDKLKNIINR